MWRYSIPSRLCLPELVINEYLIDLTCTFDISLVLSCVFLYWYYSFKSKTLLYNFVFSPPDTSFLYTPVHPLIPPILTSFFCLSFSFNSNILSAEDKLGHYSPQNQQKLLIDNLVRIFSKPGSSTVDLSANGIQTSPSGMQDHTGYSDKQTQSNTFGYIGKQSN